jgi:hypothetical protein
MVKNKFANKIARLHALRAQLATLGPFLRGSVVRLGPRQTAMLSLNKNGKTRLVYLGESRVAQATRYSENYKRLLSIIEETTLLLMDLLKKRVPHAKICAPPVRSGKTFPPRHKITAIKTVFRVQ